MEVILILRIEHAYICPHQVLIVVNWIRWHCWVEKEILFPDLTHRRMYHDLFVEIRAHI